MRQPKNKPEFVSAAELIEDTGVYPREGISSHNVTKLTEALAAGDELPPIIAERKTKRIVDGFHRRRAWRQFAKNDAVEVPVLWRDYEDDAALFMDAVSLNSIHGLALDNQSRIRVTIIGSRLGLTVTQLSLVLHAPERSVEKLSMQIVESPTTRTPIPSKPIARHLEGKLITADQQDALDSAGGLPLLGQITQLRRAVESKLYDSTNPKHLAALHALARLITETVPIAAEGAA